MNRYLLLILLTSWSLVVTESCDTGVAFANSMLSVQRSSLANADVALLERYNAPTVEKCMEDCCAGIYGSCTVASYKRNSTKKNCFHFNCRPLKQCKFLPSSSTDSFTFSSNPHALHPVPFSQTSPTTQSTTTITTTTKAKSSFDQPHALEEIATFIDEQANFKNDNTSVKPRKGVSAMSPDSILSRSGIKPRKGVTLEDVPHSKFLLSSLNKSNVKPRKGVGTYSSNESSNDQNVNVTGISPTVSSDSIFNNSNSSDQPTANELVSELAKLFEDDPSAVSTVVSQVASSGFYTISPTSASSTYSTTTVKHVSNEIFSSYSTKLYSVSSSNVEPSFSSAPIVESSTDVFQSTTQLTATVLDRKMTPIASAVPSLSAKALLTMDEPKSLDKTLLPDSEESESSRKYKSSMHLVLSLVFGLLVLFAVIGVVAKRMYDSWQRRDYYRMNYLIDGIYNGYE